MKVKELNLFRLQASCLGTPSMNELPCGMAIDYNVNTMWSPNNQYDQYFDLTLSRKVGIKEIDILQYEWSHGRATKVR